MEMTDTTLVLVARWVELKDRIPHPVRVADVDLILLKVDDGLSVLHGRCPHRAGRLSKGRVEGDFLVCPYHGWDFHVETGKSACVEGESIKRFSFARKEDDIFVSEQEIQLWRSRTPLGFENEDLMDEEESV